MRRTPARRSSAEWAKLVAEWQQSGLSAKAFAARQGLKASTLSWWKWKLGSQGSLCPAPGPEPRLVPVEIVGANIDEGVGWEFRSAGGHVLRVYEALTDAQLEQIIIAIAVDEVDS